jgi:hypothetical protein
MKQYYVFSSGQGASTSQKIHCGSCKKFLLKRSAVENSARFPDFNVLILMCNET